MKNSYTEQSSIRFSRTHAGLIEFILKKMQTKLNNTFSTSETFSSLPKGDSFFKKINHFHLPYNFFMKKYCFYLLIFSMFIPTEMLNAKEAISSKKSSAIPERREFPLNPEFSPCQDFYQYVCSKAVDSFQLREDRSRHIFSFSDSNERILEKKKKYFLNLSRTKPQEKKETALKNYYLSCMSPKLRAQAEVNEVKNTLAWIQNLKNNQEAVQWFRDNYTKPEATPVSWGNTNNFDSPNLADLYLETQYMSLPEKSYYKNPALMKDLTDLIKLFFKEINFPNPDVATAAVIDFETKLAEVTPTPAEIRQIVNDRRYVTKSKLLAEYPGLGLSGLLEKLPENVLIRDWFPMGMKFQSDYFSNQPIENIKAILAYNNLSSIMDDAYPKFFNASFEFNKKHMGGANKRAERQERCTRASMAAFGKEIDFILWTRFFPDFDRAKFVDLAEKIRTSLQKSISENNWLSSEAKKEALAKIKKAKLQLVAPENEKDWDFLPEAEYSNKNYIQNLKLRSQAKIEKELKEFKEGLNPTKWYMGPLTVNAYYDANYNKFVMPVGILQYPFYDAKLSLEENLGAVGSVIGHELGHGVDDQGSRFDSDGKQRQWMKMQDLAEFSKRGEKLIQQFDKIGHNGRLTLGENIGDLVGLSTAVKAASEDPDFVKNTERQKKLFVAYARAWCGVMREKAKENQLKTDPHALGEARVNEQVKHQDLFAQAFVCKPGDKMYLEPNDRVKIW